MTNQRTETLTAPAGGTYDGFLFLPAGGSGPGVLLLPEIFGVGPFMRSKAAHLAALGYVVLCPDLFWRTERGVEHAHDEAGHQAAFASVAKWMETVDDATRIGDLLGALAHLRALPEVGGAKVAVMGYCLGGRLAYEVAVAGDPDTCVSYYGSGIGTRLTDPTLSSITCPVLFHYGAEDAYIPHAEVEAVMAAFADRQDVEVHEHAGAAHAFENFDAPMNYDPATAERSWATTTAWLADRFASS